MSDREDQELEEWACVECGRWPLDGERFRAYLTIDDEVAVYCSDCAAREFGGAAEGEPT